LVVVVAADQIMAAAAAVAVALSIQIPWQAQQQFPSLWVQAAQVLSTVTQLMQ
jgi:hypothetical protein